MSTRLVHDKEHFSGRASEAIDGGIYEIVGSTWGDFIARCYTGPDDVKRLLSLDGKKGAMAGATGFCRARVRKLSPGTVIEVIVE